MGRVPFGWSTVMPSASVAPKPGHAVRGQETDARTRQRSVLRAPAHMNTDRPLSAGARAGGAMRRMSTALRPSVTEAVPTKPVFNLGDLTEIQRRRAQMVFEKFDVNGNGRIGKEEMRKARTARLCPDPP